MSRRNICFASCLVIALAGCKPADGTAQAAASLQAPANGPEPVPAGRLDYDAGNRRGQLTTITPYEDFRVLVSAEPPVPMGHPSGQVVIEEYVTS